MPNPRCPLEIQDLIIDEAGTSETLKIFSFVCRSWRQRAKQHLFRLFPLHDICVEDTHQEAVSKRVDLMNESSSDLVQTSDLFNCIKGYSLLPDLEYFQALDWGVVTFLAAPFSTNLSRFHTLLLVTLRAWWCQIVVIVAL